MDEDQKININEKDIDDTTFTEADYFFTSISGKLRRTTISKMISFFKKKLEVAFQITVDDALSDSSTNPVQNKVLNEKISELKSDIEQLKQNGAGAGTGLSTEAINKLEEVGNYLVYTTADGGSKWTELITILRNGSSGGGSGETEVTLSSISATYTGGDVAVGTSLNDLTGITVTATYSDGSTSNVTGYTLSGTIAEGSNTITVSYGGKTTTFTVTGVASGGTESNIAYLPVAYKGSEYWAYFPGVVAGDVYYIRYNISDYAVLRDFSPWAAVSASETTWTYEKYNDNYYKITFVKDYGDIGLLTNSSWADLEYSTIKYSKNAVPVE